MNIGSGKGTTMKELIACVSNITNKSIQWKIGPKREYDPPSLVADISLVKKELKWNPEYTIKDIVSDAWCWEQTKY